MKSEYINLKRKLRTDANQISHYNRHIKDCNTVLIIYDFENKIEYYLDEEDIYSYNGGNSKKRYKKNIYNYKNYINEDLRDFAFENHYLVYSKYFIRDVLNGNLFKEGLHKFQIEIIKKIKRTFSSDAERDFFIKNVNYLYENKEDLFIEYLNEFHLNKVNKKRFDRILKQIDNKTIFFNLNNKDKLERLPITKEEHQKDCECHAMESSMGIDAYRHYF